MITKPTLTLYTRVGCHLCDEMKQQLGRFQHLSINIVDVDTDNDLKQRYGERVPVLAAGDQDICYSYLDEDLLLKYLAKIKLVPK